MSSEIVWPTNLIERDRAAYDAAKLEFIDAWGAEPKTDAEMLCVRRRAIEIVKAEKECAIQ